MLFSLSFLSEEGNLKPKYVKKYCSVIERSWKHGSMASVSQGCLGLMEHGDGHTDTLRTEQEGQVPVFGAPGAAEMRLASGMLKAALRWRSSGQQPSL